MAMIRSELLSVLAKDNPGLRGEDVEQVVDIFFDEITQRLAEGGRVELRGFGAFSTRARAMPARAAIRGPGNRCRCKPSGCPISAPARKCAASSTTAEAPAPLSAIASYGVRALAQGSARVWRNGRRRGLKIP